MFSCFGSKKSSYKPQFQCEDYSFTTSYKVVDNLVLKMYSYTEEGECSEYRQKKNYS